MFGYEYTPCSTYVTNARQQFNVPNWCEEQCEPCDPACRPVCSSDNCHESLKINSIQVSLNNIDDKTELRVTIQFQVFGHFCTELLLASECCLAGTSANKITEVKRVKSGHGTIECTFMVLSDSLKEDTNYCAVITLMTDHATECDTKAFKYIATAV